MGMFGDGLHVVSWGMSWCVFGYDGVVGEETQGLSVFFVVLLYLLHGRLE
jgi:dipeptide/tripeptide permease